MRPNPDSGRTSSIGVRPLLVPGPQTTCSERAHASTEICSILGGEASWRVDGPEQERLFTPGELVFTAPHQRHEIRTGARPLLAAYTWKADPTAPSYHRSGGPWRNGPRREPDLVNR